MKKILTLALCIYSISLFSQDRIPVELQNSKVYLNIITPSIGFEQKVSANQSLLFRGGIRLHAEVDEETDDFEGGLLPYAELEFRNYYPRKRVKKELRTNSGHTCPK